MGTPLIWKSFQLHNFMFGYMYPTLLYMNPKDRVITTRTLNWKMIPWLTIGVFGVAFVGIPPLIYIFIREAYFPRGTTSMIKISIYICLLVCNVLPLGLSTLPLFATDYVPAFNDILKWNKCLEKDFPELANLVAKEDERRPDLIGMFLCLTVVVTASSPLAVTFAAVVLNLDQFDYVIEDILPEPMERETVEHILIPFFVRFVLVFSIGLEGLRTLSMSFTLTATYVYVITHGLRILGKITSPTQFFFRYTQIRMANLMIRGTLGYISALFIAAGQVSTVVLLWMTVNGYDHAPSFILFLMFPVLALIVMAFTIIMFQQSIAIFERSHELVENWKIGCTSRTSGKGTYELKINREIKKVGIAQRPIVMTIGGLRVIKRGFQIEYLSLLMDNFTNAVLVIKV
ncbi:unnamed protein product [Orchesella dallaii]|uniref:Odorant receptor n=1 Tax=Orchesella dallaii TaxID=48710 RepID=A0ABP1RMJ9_9HEXA